MKKLFSMLIIGGTIGFYPLFSQIEINGDSQDFCHMHKMDDMEKKHTHSNAMHDKMCGIKHGKMHEMLEGMGMYSVKKLFYKAENMVPENLKQKVKALRMELIEKAIRQKTEIKIEKMKLSELLKSPDFNPSDAKKLLKSITDKEYKLKEYYINALSNLRKTIGKDNFKKLFSMPMMRHKK